MASDDQTTNPRKPTCLAPWLVAHTSTESIRGLCCMANRVSERKSERFQSLEESVNSPYKKEVRKKMLNGEFPEECSYCKFANSTRTYRDFLYEKYQDLVPQILERTRNDGTTSVDPVYFDYRSPVCNLTCKTCAPYHSTAYYQKMKDSPEIGERVISFQEMEWMNVPAVKAHYTAKLVPELIQNIRGGKVRQIYFAGGEPLIDPHHTSILQACIESGHASKIELQYNTNLTASRNVLTRVVEQWAHFHYVSVGASMDGIGEIGEWVRAGVDFTEWEANFDFVMANKPPNVRLTVDVVLTSLSLLDLPSLCEWAFKHKTVFYPALMLGQEYAAAFLRCELYPMKVRRGIVENFRAYFNELPEERRSQMDNLRQTVELILTKPEFSAFTHPFKRQIDNFEKLYPGHRPFREFLLASPLTREWAREAQF